MENLQVSNANIRAEYRNGYCYVRNLCGNGVIDGIVPVKKQSTVIEILNSIADKSFSQVWDEFVNNAIKMDYQRN